MRTLVIGEKEIKGATKCLTWEELNTENTALGDYENVFLNLETLSVADLRKISTTRIAKKIAEALVANTKIYCLTAPNISGNTNSRYSIFPFKITTIHETGEAFTDKKNDPYYKRLKKWGFYLEHEEARGWRFSSLLQTRHGFDLALFAELDRFYGYIIFYPPQTLNSGESSFKNLFDYILKDKDEVPKLPDFINNLKVEGENDLITAITEDRKSIEELTERVKENDNKLKDVKSKKGILAFKGKPLEMAVGKVLNEIGVNFGGIEVYEEDGMIELEGNSIPVEIKGHDKGMTMDDLRQIIQRGPKAKTKEEVIKGVLIGNPYAGTPLENRGIDFESNLVKAAIPFNICLLSTSVLFKYWQSYRMNKQSLLPKKILNQRGILKFEP